MDISSRPLVASSNLELSTLFACLSLFSLGFRFGFYFFFYFYFFSAYRIS